MDKLTHDTHPFIKLLKVYSVFFLLAAFVFLVSWASTSYQPGHQAPFLVIMYSFLITPCVGAIYSIYLVIKSKDKNDRIIMIIISILHLLFIWSNWLRPLFDG